MTLEILERLTIEAAIQHFEGNITIAARSLGMARATLYRRLELYRAEDFRKLSTGAGRQVG